MSLDSQVIEMFEIWLSNARKYERKKEKNGHSATLIITILVTMFLKVFLTLSIYVYLIAIMHIDMLYVLY